MSSLSVLLPAFVAAGLLSSVASSPAQEQIKLSVQPGLKFDRVRFAVSPGAHVIVRLNNPDQMIHNFVVVQPGAREEVVAAALALGADGPAKNFIPDSEKILFHTEALNPGEQAELSFTAPEQEGVYPYVCTSMGHGFIMYGAMYVTTKPLPPLADDPYVPHEAAPAAADASELSHVVFKRPVVSRTFLPDCGPAAIAVGLPGNQAYVFDAGICRVRYAWKGGFVDNRAHWAGKGEAFGQIVGRIYYRAPEGALIRIGRVEAEPAARWRGYEMGAQGPVFHYTLDGHEVSETPRALPAGSGWQMDYAIASGDAPVFLVTDPEGDATFTSSAGAWDKGVLSLTAAEAAKFTLMIKERPGVEPLKYWSMNDQVIPSKRRPSAGVLGRAFTSGASDAKGRTLGSGISLGELNSGATLMAWVQLSEAALGKEKSASAEPVFATGGGDEGRLLSATEPDGRWHHLALTVDAQGTRTRWENGQAETAAPGLPLSGSDEILIGSAGAKVNLHGLIDEARIYDRPLSADEIGAIYRREAAALTAP